MAREETAPADSGANPGGEKTVSRSRGRSREIAARGIRTAGDFAACMSALMGDVLEGDVPPREANAVCNAGGKLLKAVEMQYRYGTGGEHKKEAQQRAAAPSPPMLSLV